jgi:uncharacterized protein (DUF924 family)
MAQEAILTFWFGPTPEDLTQEAIMRWFRADASFDREIAQRFGKLQKAAAQGAFRDWKETPRGRLALLIVLDQFSRNLHRHSPKAYESDAFCQELSLDGVELGQDKELGAFERVFFYMPLMHSEKLLHQKVSVRLYERLVSDAAMALKEGISRSLGAAQKHLEIIEAHGRFPHRNTPLGRVNTPEEEAYLEAREPGAML